MKTKKMTMASRIRNAAGYVRGWTPPICIVGGDESPHEAGEGYGWETRGGKPIDHPSAYAKVGFSNMVYVPTSRRIEVGENWIMKQRV